MPSPTGMAIHLARVMEQVCWCVCAYVCLTCLRVTLHAREWVGEGGLSAHVISLPILMQGCVDSHATCITCAAVTDFCRGDCSRNHCCAPPPPPTTPLPPPLPSRPQSVGTERARAVLQGGQFGTGFQFGTGSVRARTPLTQAEVGDP